MNWLDAVLGFYVLFGACNRSFPQRRYRSCDQMIISMCLCVCWQCIQCSVNVKRYNIVQVFSNYKNTIYMRWENKVFFFAYFLSNYFCQNLYESIDVYYSYSGINTVK